MSNSSKLIDICSEEMRKNYVRSAVQKGLVVTGRFPDINHPKFYVFMAVEHNFRNAHGFFINSNPHSLSSRNMFILQSQIEIPPNTYEFLPKPTPSYLDCHELRNMDFFEMINALVAQPSKICGHLNSAHLQGAIAAIQNNRTFTNPMRVLLGGQLILPPNFLT